MGSLLNRIAREQYELALLPKFHLKERSAKGLNLRPHGGPRKGPPCPTGIAFAYTKVDVKELRAHSKARTPVAKIAKLTKRSKGSLRQKALTLGIKLDHRR